MIDGNAGCRLAILLGTVIKVLCALLILSSLP